MELKYKVGAEEKAANITRVQFEIKPEAVEPTEQAVGVLNFEVDEAHIEGPDREIFLNTFFLKAIGPADESERLEIGPMELEIKSRKNSGKKIVRMQWPIKDTRRLGAGPAEYSVQPTFGRGQLEADQEGLHSEQTLKVRSSVRSIVDRTSGEIKEALEVIGQNISRAANSTVNTRLQPVGAAGSWELALWVLIKKATTDLSFDKFSEYMDHIFCGKVSETNDRQRAGNSRLIDRRSTPFINVDSYRSIKIATEAFTMVNYMIQDQFTSEQVEDLLSRVAVTDNNVNKEQLDKWWKSYKTKVNLGVDEKGEPKEDLEMLPYLAVIQDKLKSEPIKDTSFDSAFERYLDGDGQSRIAENCHGLIRERLAYPSFLELIWSYWHEESMMVQGLKAITQRFQNIRGPQKEDPLVGLNIDPLRPLGNLLWGYIQDEQHRLTVLRRAYEYDHHYGITLDGAAVRNMRTADSRSKFIEAFHRLLNQTSEFYKNSDDMTRRPDAFPVLNALKEVHLILSEGAHNQYGDLPSTARTEMLMQQWLLARPEFREFLPTRIMVAYPEPWMPQVAALNKLQGWTETSPIHFRDLGRFGEQILLSVRFGNWSDITNRDTAFHWANFWREQIQGYIHAYRAVTGVDLSLVVVGKSVDAHPPSYHLTRRLKAQQNGTVSAPSANGKARRNGTAARNGKVKKEWI